MDSTHPVQFAAIGVFAAIDVVGLIALNRHKREHPAAPKWSWEARRNAFWALIATLVTLACVLDVHYPIDSSYVMPIKAYAFAFPLGLLDLYFSKTRGVPAKCIVGASLWCSTVLLRQLALDYHFGRRVDVSVTLAQVSVGTGFVEMFRYVCALLGIGLLSDLLFSPMHRATHHPKVYKRHHKEHHEYTNNLTALVLYHGALLDDFLMPFTTTIGGFLYVYLLSLFGLEGQTYSNLTGYVFVYNTLLSHAHDVRCARLLAPLPDSLNFVAYHYVHHISPSSNFGLTKPSDLLWDYLLGVNTIRKIEEVDVGVKEEDDVCKKQ